MNKSRTCICCGKAYSYCPNCPSDVHKPSYMTIFCGENCKTIFDAANRYGFGLISKKEAKAIIESCDLTKLDTFEELVKRDVKSIIQVDEPKNVKKVVKNEPKE